MADVTSIHAFVGISRLAEMTGATVRALRYYEEAGLIKPRRTAAGVRCFTPDQCDLVFMIVRLRRCEVPLDVIRDLLAGSGSSSDRKTRLQAVLHRKAQELARKLEVVTATLSAA